MIRHSIERKILIPFMLIVLTPSFTIGVVAMWSSYQSDKNQKLIAINETFLTIERYASALDKQVEAGELTERKAKAFMKMLIYEIHGMYVKDEHGEITKQGVKVKKENLNWLNEKNIFQSSKGFLKEKMVLTKTLPQWEWRLYIAIEFSVFSGSLPNIQKYTLLIIIFTSVIAVEFTIVFSHHLSKPIRSLAEFCSQVSMGEKVKPLNIRNGRKDEIGVLSHSLKEMVQTLSERRQQLNKMKQLNETILNSVHVGMILKQGSSWIYNDAAKKMIEHHSLLKEKVEKLDLNETKTRKEEIWDFKQKEDKVYYAVNYKLLEEIEGSAQYIITFEDITQRRKLEQRIERMQRLASLGEMASGIAHEIRNPLAGVKTTTELLIRRLDLSQQNLALTENMLIEIERVNKIITNLLQFSRPIVSKPQNINLNETVTSVFLLMETVAKEHQVILKNEHTDLDIKADRDHLRQILLNLIINGIHAMPTGGELTVSSIIKEGEVTLSVSDTGIGMDEDIVSKVFDPFFTTRSEGTGLGLSIVHQLVVQNRGEIDVTSQKGKGTTFYITFPIGKERPS